MAGPILILISSHPKESHRAVEGIRIGLGLIGNDYQVRIVLMDHAPLLLGEDNEDLVDGEILLKFLPSFKEMEQPIYIEELSLKTAELDQCEYPIESVSMTQIARFLDCSEHLLVFS